MAPRLGSHVTGDSAQGSAGAGLRAAPEPVAPGAADPATAATAPSAARTLRVDGQRLLARLRDLGRIGAAPGGGVSRLAFSEADVAARAWLRDEAEGHGLEARTDTAGNLVVRRRGDPTDVPVVMTGSHLDTVVRGGTLDGAYGVVAGLEVLETLQEHAVELPCPPVLVAFANEEGASFRLPMWGSRAIAGATAGLPLDAGGVDGRDLRQALAAVGGDLARLGECRWPAGSIAAFVELHVEQGPVLEDAAVDIGLVEAIVGRRVLEIELRGQARHSGTTPMVARHDALAAAAEVVHAVERLATGGPCLAATVGRLEVCPNMVNVVPDRARLCADLRAPDDGLLDVADERLRADLAAVAARRGVEVEVVAADRIPPAPMDPGVQAVLREVTATLGRSWIALASGAGHDAQFMATVAPTGMVFVPSHRGISHAPEEHTDAVDLVQGADVLLHALVSLAAGRGAPGDRR